MTFQRRAARKSRNEKIGNLKIREIMNSQHNSTELTTFLDIYINLQHNVHLQSAEDLKKLRDGEQQGRKSQLSLEKACVIETYQHSMGMRSRWRLPELSFSFVK